MQTISFKPLYETGDILYDFTVDNNKMKLVSKNVVNVTRLTYYDSGQYICDLIVTINKEAIDFPRRQDVIVLKIGKTCI